MRVAKVGALVIAVALVGTTIAGRVLHARDDARWKAPGMLVDVGGGRRMHLYCMGAGSPTVIFEAGLGDFSVPSWYKVQPPISAFTRTCSYDRAGTGWSDPSSELPLPDAMVRDLHTLLARAGERAPYVLVGHSLGGPVVRHYAAHYRDDVVGLVLIDGSHEDQKKRQPIPRWVGVMVSAFPVVNALGLDRVASSADPADSISAINVARSTRASPVANSVAIYHVLDAFLDQIRRDARPFGDLPLIVLTAGVVTPDPGQSMEEARKAQAVWFDMQKDLASRSTRGRWIIADQSRHHIQHDQPELVIQAIRDVIDSARAKGTPTR